MTNWPPECIFDVQTSGHSTNPWELSFILIIAKPMVHIHRLTQGVNTGLSAGGYVPTMSPAPAQANHNKWAKFV